MKIDVLTIFPEFFQGPFDASLLGRAHETGLVQLAVHDLRDWTGDPRRTVDDAPYGGGAGMVMTPAPFFAAVEALYGGVDQRPRTLVMTPRGRQFDQRMATTLATEDHLLLLCGRYEGIDERVHLHLAHDEISVGDVVLAGGEVAAAMVVEAVTRLVPGVMGNADSGVEESFGTSGPQAGLLEHPQYTRPASFRGWQVPGVLRSGDHGRVQAWRTAQARSRTRLVRPDLSGPENLS
ncbi:tRNA (guanosine(37)-N1)-methyltransferase TrmD [Euzebya tangerina]|uniref:tRNA (guanosine(37)-N1)-methyltransferase TrmD n=1 Tax=Euzebya tangerina TaxID=591198 RepID=UPI000E32211F|nr:tRNA (guanosine(37)-N1)-methyltransferase TrmD [Euzebya tangerina]